MKLAPQVEHPVVFSKGGRTGLLVSLVVLITLLLSALVWLVGRYEQSRFEDQLERSASNMATEIRAHLATRALQAQRLPIQVRHGVWSGLAAAQSLLDLHPDMLRIEQRDSQLKTEASLNSPAQTLGIYSKFSRQNFLPEIYQACSLALRSSEPAYSSSYFVPQGDGTGFEVIDMCVPKLAGGRLAGYIVITFSLQSILKQWANTSSPAGFSGAGQQEVLLIEADGSRLAAYGTSKRRGDKFAAQSLLDLPGVTLILRVETWIAAPFWLANTPTALVLVLALALSIVLWLLFRDTRKRLRTEAEFRQSQERLQRSARLATLGEMASMLSHELNQPLAAIASYATGSLNLLETEPHALDIYEIKMALERIATQSQRAGQVIKSVNDFVRRREADRSAIAPKALFDAILPLLTLQARQHDIRLIVQTSPDLPLVWCDKTLIEQVLINLARNGMQAMQTLPSDAGVRVLTMTAQTSAIEPNSNSSPNAAAAVRDQYASNSIAFWIEDTGPGISPDVKEKLFTPFFTTKEEGTGLGLSLCRTAIEQHGSNLTYTSNEGAQTGTRFGFQLKIYMDSQL
jgi:signal transduction histidine kinase